LHLSNHFFRLDMIMGKIYDVINNFSYILATLSFFYTLHTTSKECFNNKNIYFSLITFIFSILLYVYSVIIKDS
jgi:hypothetical protein